MENDTDVMMDVYLTRDQREAYERLRKDAARYRWLRDMRNREQAADMVSHKMNLDAAIDAAMNGANS